jgi:hypothetical protein
MTIRKLLIGTAAALMLAISPAYALSQQSIAPCGPGVYLTDHNFGGGHLCLSAKVGSWSIDEHTLILTRGGEGSNFIAASGDDIQNEAFEFYSYVIRTPSKPPASDDDRSEDASNAQHSDGKLTVEIGEGDYWQLIEEQATVEIYLYPDAGAGIKVLAKNGHGRLEFQPTSDVLDKLMQARERIIVKIPNFPALTFQAKNTAEAVNALLEVCKKAKNAK